MTFEEKFKFGEPKKEIFLVLLELGARAFCSHAG